MIVCRQREMAPFCRMIAIFRHVLLKLTGC